jgi:hypothetical protein
MQWDGLRQESRFLALRGMTSGVTVAPTKQKRRKFSYLVIPAGDEDLEYSRRDGELRWMWPGSRSGLARR